MGENIIILAADSLIYVFESFDRYMNNTDNLQEDYAYNDKRPMNVGHVAIELNVQQATDLSAYKLSELLQGIAETYLVIIYFRKLFLISVISCVFNPQKYNTKPIMRNNNPTIPKINLIGIGIISIPSLIIDAWNQPITPIIVPIIRKITSFFPIVIDFVANLSN